MKLTGRGHRFAIGAGTTSRLPPYSGDLAASLQLMRGVRLLTNRLREGSMRRTLLGVGLLLLGFAPAASAQASYPTQTQLRREIRTLLLELREAASRRDWDAMAYAFPSSGPIRSRVHDVVAGGPNAGGLSFWTPTAKPDFDELVLVPVRSDLVALSLPFTHGSGAGSYGAVFERRGDQWQLTCFQEAFPTTNLAPGCVADLPGSQ
jgi:hypothetical protein